MPKIVMNITLMPLIRQNVGDASRIDRYVDLCLVNFDSTDEGEKDGTHRHRCQSVPSVREIGCLTDKPFLLGGVFWFFLSVLFSYGVCSLWKKIVSKAQTRPHSREKT
jgi:hypothetical protein